MVALQDRISDRRLEDALAAIFASRWGSLWYDACDRGRLHVGVTRRSPTELRRVLRRARSVVSARGFRRDVVFVAVRSTYRQLSSTSDHLGAVLQGLLEHGLISTGIDTSRNAIVIDVARTAHHDDWQRINSAVTQAPVNVIVHRVNAENLFVEPL
jgi:hypothetical protein